MPYFSKFTFFFSLIIGTLITLSSSSWIGMWIGLELNLISFIPLIIDTNNYYSTESAIKYFLVQSFASLIFLFTCILYLTKISFINFIFLSQENIIINFSILLKLGAGPFHFWFPNIIEGLPWINSLILLTWQKLAPLTVISYTSFTPLLNLFIYFSAFTGAIGGLNQTSLRKLLAFSSINHISWLLIASSFNNSLWQNYFFIYSLINISIIIIFKSISLFHINQIFFIKNNQLITKFWFLINFFSLGGLPPFLGFLPKWLVIENIILSNFIFLTLFLVNITLITLYFYARLTFSAFLLSYPLIKWNLFNFNKNWMINITIAGNLSRIIFLAVFLINFKN